MKEKNRKKPRTVRGLLLANLLALLLLAVLVVAALSLTGLLGSVLAFIF